MRVSEKQLRHEIMQINTYTNYKYNISMRYASKQIEINSRTISFKSNKELMNILKPYHDEAENNCIKKYGKCVWY